MFGQPPSKGALRGIWLVGAMALVLAGMLLLALLGKAPRATKLISFQPSPTHTSPIAPSSATATQTASESVTGAPQAHATATLTPFPTLTYTPAPTATSTPKPSPSPTATLTPPPQPTVSPTPSPTETATPVAISEPTGGDHFWLERPIAPSGVDTVARFYPYASRADGSYPVHHGVEFVNPMGTPIYATAPGVVIVAGDDERIVYGARNNFYGLLVVQELDNRIGNQPVYVLYGHLSEIAVEVGQHLDTGDVLGKVGMSGVAEGPHLHLEVRVGQNDYGATVNPELWLKPKAGTGALAGLLAGPDGLPIAAEIQVTLARAATPNVAAYTLVTYPARGVNPDPVWQENVAISGLSAGQWVVRASRGGRLYTQVVDIEEGKTSWFLIRLAQ